MMHRNRSVNVHQFAMVPRAEIPRAAFNIQKAHKATYDAGYLYPLLCEEILPGDSFRVKMTAFARLATPIFPIMDNLYMETFFFFVPNRLVWDNWQKFMGEQENPGDSTSYLVPKVPSQAGGFTVGGIYDHFGLPTAGQLDPAGVINVNALPLRGYNLIFNEWFRDQNMQNSAPVDKDDGPDTTGQYGLKRRGKRHDYFTSALPWPQKGDSVTLPLGQWAPVRSDVIVGGTGRPKFEEANPANVRTLQMTSGSANATWSPGSPTVTKVANWAGYSSLSDGGPGLVADLSLATAATINQLRQSFQVQKLLERDARGGTRYTEIVRAHFGVISPDARLQRPEYLGGGSTPVVVNPIAQTSATGVQGGSTPAGSLSAVGTALAHNHGFSQSFTEHGYVIGLINFRADLTYQQGVRRHWSRSTRYDYYFPAFAMLGEQTILRKEIYARGVTGDDTVFGYQERWAEYRYSPSSIVGLFRSTAAGTIDPWHLAQNFTSAPVLGSTFIEENPPLSRTLAVGSAANGAQFIFDSFFDMQVVRPMPLYSVPGLIDHF